jgi:hypothetical protein
MRISQFRTLASLAAATGLCLMHAGNASADMSLSYEETASGLTGNGTGTAFTSLPASDSYARTFGAATGSVPGSPGVTFNDYYVFTVAAATADSMTSEINLGKTLSIADLEERVYSIPPNATQPVVTGTPAGFQTNWTSPMSFPAGTESGMFTVMDPTMLSAGTYVLEIQGDVTGSSGGTYTGSLNLNPVPLPAALPLLLSGLGLLGGTLRKRFTR